MAQQLDRPDRETSMELHYAAEHRRSMQEHRPDLYRAMEQAGTLTGHCRQIGESAERLFDDLMEPAITRAQTMKGYEARLGMLEAARLEADGQVMRDLVLVPEQPTTR